LEKKKGLLEAGLSVGKYVLFKTMHSYRFSRVD